MNVRSTLISAVLLLPLGAIAQTPAKPEPPKSEAQIRAETLLEQSHKLSDIRSKDAPAFRLTATFSFIGKDLASTQGTYTEVWVSQSQWWRETVVNNLRRVEVGGPNRRWLVDSAPDFPETAGRVPELMKMFPPINQTLEFESVVEDTNGKATGECAITKAGPRGEKSAFCFEKKSHALLQKVSPDVRPMNAVNYSCLYGVYRKFGDFLFPREMSCFEEKHHKLDAKVLDIVAEPSPNADLFKPPPGAVERVECSGISVAPVPISSPPPTFPGTNGQSSSALLSLVVGIDGKPQEVKVRHSGGKDFDDQATRAVSRWKFKPSTCDGQPSPAEINVEVRFDFPH